jgi:MYXO-CTERM domain-containing protein
MRSAFALAAVLLVPSIASAHAVLTYPPPRNTTAIKNAPCGPLDSVRSTIVTTLTGGTKLQVKWNETIEHTGHYRLALDLDGQDFSIPQTANGNTEGTLNVVKDLIPDIAAPLNGVPRPYMYEITLPDVACNNCTLQLIQMMTDNPPYTPDDDLYFNCADITIVPSNSGGGADAGVDMTPDAGDEGGGSNNGGGGGGEISGGCSTGNATGLLALVGLLGLRRRRRS